MEEVLPGVLIKVATTPHLIAMKVLSQDVHRRPNDIHDLFALIGCSKKSDLAQAEELLKLIGKRGFGRRRNLLKELARFVKLSKKQSQTLRVRSK